MYSSGRQTEDHIIRKHMNIICFLTVLKKITEPNRKKREYKSESNKNNDTIVQDSL